MPNNLNPVARTVQYLPYWRGQPQLQQVHNPRDFTYTRCRQPAESDKADGAIRPSSSWSFPVPREDRGTQGLASGKVVG